MRLLLALLPLLAAASYAQTRCRLSFAIQSPNTRRCYDTGLHTEPLRQLFQQTGCADVAFNHSLAQTLELNCKGGVTAAASLVIDGCPSAASMNVTLTSAASTGGARLVARNLQWEIAEGGEAPREGHLSFLRFQPSARARVTQEAACEDAGASEVAGGHLVPGGALLEELGDGGGAQEGLDGGENAE